MQALRPLLTAALATFAIASVLWGQSEAPAPAQVYLQGTVVSQVNGEPLRRVQVVLRAQSSGKPPLSAMTDERGHFVFSPIAAGRYSIRANRDGYVPSVVAYQNGARLPIYFPVEGSRVAGLQVKLRPAGVLAGRVRFDDAEPATGAEVQAHREYFEKGRHGYSVAGKAIANDRGEYRIHGLPPGTYHISATYQPPAVPAGATELPRLGPNGEKLPDVNYVTTFHPSTPRLLNASAVTLTHGQEAGNLDIFLRPEPTVKIQGRVTSSISGQLLQGGVLHLRRPDASLEASVNAPYDVKPVAAGGFEINRVSPGPYILTVDATESGKRLFARMPLTVNEADIPDLRILVEPSRTLRGRIVLEDGAKLKMNGLRVRFEPRSETTDAATSRPEADGDFMVPFLSGETYDVFIPDLPDDVFIRSAKLESADLLTEGFEASSSPLTAAVIVLSAKGGRVEGQIESSAYQPAAGASVLLMPDPAAGRLAYYDSDSSDEYGYFYFRGIAPGRYTLLTWLDDPPCDFYNPRVLDECRKLGESVTVTESEGQRRILRVRP